MGMPRVLQKVIDFIRGDDVHDYIALTVSANEKDLHDVLLCSFCKSFVRSSRENYYDHRKSLVHYHLFLTCDILDLGTTLVEETVTGSAALAWSYSRFLLAHGNMTGDLYVIFYGAAANIFRIRGNHENHERFCVVFARSIGEVDIFSYGLIPDQMVMQKLMIETDELRFMRVAHKDYSF